MRMSCSSAQEPIRRGVRGGLRDQTIFWHYKVVTYLLDDVADCGTD